MFRSLGHLVAGLVFSSLVVPASGADAPAAKPSAAKYTLRYKFKAGDTVKWKVEQRVNMDMSVGGTDQNVELFTGSVKAWKIKEVAADGSATFENSAEDIEMKRKFSGKDEVRYNSKTDKEPPSEFATVAHSIGVPLARITIDARGKVVKRQQLAGPSQDAQSLITIPMPEGPIAVGETWSLPHDMEVPMTGKLIKKVKTVQAFNLLEVADNIATIRISNQILTPVDDPAVQVQLIQFETTGTVKFDLAAGRIVAQRIDADKEVIGFRGAASRCRYRMQFSETLLAGDAKVAQASPAAAETKAAESKPVTIAQKPADVEKRAAEPTKAPEEPAKTPGEAAKPAPAEPRTLKPVHAVVPEPKAN